VSAVPVRLSNLRVLQFQTQQLVAMPSLPSVLQHLLPPAGHLVMSPQFTGVRHEMPEAERTAFEERSSASSVLGYGMAKRLLR